MQTSTGDYPNIVLDNIKGFAQAAPGEMRITRDIFKFAAGYWKKQAVSFYILTKFESTIQK